MQDAQAVLDHHNKVRADVSVPPLTWSAALAAYAQQWADSLAYTNDCKMKHRDNRAVGYGENIFWGSSAQLYTPLDASIAWYGEEKQYKYRAIEQSTWFNSGHYTQMIWKNTQQIGVGISACPDGGIIIVANYYPAGNRMGQYPY